MDLFSEGTKENLLSVAEALLDVASVREERRNLLDQAAASFQEADREYILLSNQLEEHVGGIKAVDIARAIVGVYTSMDDITPLIVADSLDDYLTYAQENPGDCSVWLSDINHLRFGSPDNHVVLVLGDVESQKSRDIVKEAYRLGFVIQKYFLPRDFEMTQTERLIRDQQSGL